MTHCADIYPLLSHALRSCNPARRHATAQKRLGELTRKWQETNRSIRVATKHRAAELTRVPLTTARVAAFICANVPEFPSTGAVDRSAAAPFSSRRRSGLPANLPGRAGRVRKPGSSLSRLARDLGRPRPGSTCVPARPVCGETPAEPEFLGRNTGPSRASKSSWQVEGQRRSASFRLVYIVERKRQLVVLEAVPAAPLGPSHRYSSSDSRRASACGRRGT
jgi:hypothetical protein